jgi:hypothetical protein
VGAKLPDGNRFQLLPFQCRSDVPASRPAAFQSEHLTPATLNVQARCIFDIQLSPKSSLISLVMRSSSRFMICPRSRRAAAIEDAAAERETLLAVLDAEADGEDA